MIEISLENIILSLKKWILFKNTLDTTVDYEVIAGKPDTFIITGDIDAMWLRDSTAQVWPYMPLIHKEDKLKKLIQSYQ